MLSAVSRNRWRNARTVRWRSRSRENVGNGMYVCLYMYRIGTKKISRRVSSRDVLLYIFTEKVAEFYLSGTLYAAPPRMEPPAEPAWSYVSKTYISESGYRLRIESPHAGSASSPRIEAPHGGPACHHAGTPCGDPIRVLYSDM